MFKSNGEYLEHLEHLEHFADSPVIDMVATNPPRNPGVSKYQQTAINTATQNLATAQKSYNSAQISLSSATTSLADATTKQSNDEITLNSLIQPVQNAGIAYKIALPIYQNALKVFQDSIKVYKEAITRYNVAKNRVNIDKSSTQFNKTILTLATNNFNKAQADLAEAEFRLQYAQTH